MFVVVIFNLFYVLVKICVVFVVELNVKVISVKYGWSVRLLLNFLIIISEGTNASAVCIDFLECC